MSYSYDKFLKPLTSTDVNIQILDNGGVIKFTIEPFSVINTMVNNNLLKVNVTNRIIQIPFSSITESKLALERFQLQLDDLRNRTNNLTNLEIKNYVDNYVSVVFDRTIKINEDGSINSQYLRNNLEVKDGDFIVSNDVQKRWSILHDDKICFHSLGDNIINLSTYENLTTNYNNVIFADNKYYFLYAGLLLILNDDLSIYNEISLNYTQIYSQRNTLTYNQNDKRIYFASQGGSSFLEYYDINTETIVEVEILDIDIITNNQVNLETFNIFYNNETEEVCFINNDNNVLVFDNSLNYLKTIKFYDFNYFIDVNYTTNRIYFRGDAFQSSPEGTLWNNDGFTNLSNYQNRVYLSFTQALEFQVGNNVVGAELIMYDTINNNYYKVVFSQWTQGNSGGGFSYTRELIIDDVTFGPPVVFTKTDYGSEIDVIDNGIEITRGNSQSIFNASFESNYTGVYSNIVRILDFDFNIVDSFIVSNDSDYNNIKYNQILNKFYSTNTNPLSTNNELLVYDINGNEETIILNSLDNSIISFTISSNGKLFFITQNNTESTFNISVLNELNELITFNVTDLVTNNDLRIFSLNVDQFILIESTNSINLFQLVSNFEFISCISNLLGNNNEISIPSMSGTIALTSQIPPTVDIRTFGRLLYVDSVYGNDSTAQTNNPTKPYLTINGALNEASSNDTVVVNTGTYNQQIVLKNNVDIFCYPNVTFNNGIVDNGTSVTCKVLGRPNINGFRAIYLTGQNSNVYIEANDLNGSFDTVTIVGNNSSGNLMLTLNCNNIRAFGQYSLYGIGYCNINIKANIIEHVTAAFVFVNGMIGTFNLEFNRGIVNPTRADIFVCFLMASGSNTNLCTINTKFNEIIDTNPNPPSNVYRGVITSFGQAQLNIQGNITSTGTRAGIATSGSSPNSKIIYSGIISTRGRECIIHGNAGKLILNNSTLIRNKIESSSTNYIIVEGSAGGMFAAQNDNLNLELNNVKMVLIDSNVGIGPASSTPLIFLTGVNSYTLSKDSSIYVLNPNPETSISYESPAGMGNVFFINTYSNLNKSINITDLNTNPGYFYEINYKPLY